VEHNYIQDDSAKAEISASLPGLFRSINAFGKLQPTKRALFPALSLLARAYLTFFAVFAECAGSSLSEGLDDVSDTVHSLNIEGDTYLFAVFPTRTGDISLSLLLQR
jgi:hypothetical protein